MTSNDDPLEKIDIEAAEWLTLQMAGQLHLADELVLASWLARSPRHRAAYEKMQRAWDDLAILQQQPGNLLRHTAGLARPLRTERRIAASMMALAAGLILVVGLALFWVGNPVTALVADYSTASGEIRSVVLPDGSRVDLGPSSAIRLHFNASERRIELLGGSAFFAAVPQSVSAGRPFVVDTGHLSARALGTQFLVERLSSRDGVAVVEHAVEVTIKRPGNGQGAAILSPGQWLRYRGEAGGAAIASTDPHEIAAWRAGNLIFYQMPLQEVVAELNQYRRGRIVLAGDDLSSRVVSGVFRADDPDGALKIIAHELGLQAAALPFVVVLYK